MMKPFVILFLFAISFAFCVPEEGNVSEYQEGDLLEVVEAYIYAVQERKMNKLLSTLDYHTYYCLNLVIPYDSIDNVSKSHMKSLFKMFWSLQRDKEISKKFNDSSLDNDGEVEAGLVDDLKLICISESYALVSNHKSIFFLKQTEGVWKIFFVSEPEVFPNLNDCLNEHQVFDSIITINSELPHKQEKL